MRARVLHLALLSLAVSTFCVGQTVGTGKTVRKHRETVQDQVITPEVTRAEAAMEAKNFDAAEKDLAAVVAKDPKNYRAWFDLGFVYNETSRTPQAIDAYRKSVEANPQVFESTLNLGLLLARSGDPNAEKFLRDATKLKPTARQEEGWYRAWLSLGHVLQQTKPLEAVEAFRNAGKLSPKQAEPHLSAGLLLEKQKQYSEAAAEYRKAAELDPKSTEAQAGLVNAYTEAGQLPEAEASLRSYVKLSPDNAAAHIQLGRVLAAVHKWDDAAAELQTGLKLQSGDVAARKQLAGIFMAQKKYDEAIPHLRTAVEADPKDSELHHWLGMALMDQKKFPDAQNEFMAAVKIKPDYGEAYGDLAFAASENKNYVLTIQALQARAKFLPEIPVTYFLRATAFDHLHDRQQAAANYHKFLEVAEGRFPDQEWQAKHRLIAIEPKK